jgi:hypothetical protein
MDFMTSGPGEEVRREQEFATGGRKPRKGVGSRTNLWYKARRFFAINPHTRLTPQTGCL